MEGVVPLEDRQRKARGGKGRDGERMPGHGPALGAPRPDAGRRPGTKGLPGAQEAPGTGDARGNSASVASLGTVARARAHDLPAPGPAAGPEGTLTASEQDRLQQQQREQQARIIQLEQSLRDAQARLAQAEAALAPLREELARAQAEGRALDTERRQLHEKYRLLRAELSQAQELAARRTPARDILESRGLADVDEAVIALQGLLDRRPQELIDALSLADPAPLVRLLDQRVALVHDLGSTELGADCVIVPVSPERCEITGGSDIRGAFRRLLDACRAARVSEITIVGGSPAYRQQLKELADPHRAVLHLNLVSGTQRRTRRRAAADMRKSDLVVIWGATELDHAVSAVYTGDGAPIQRVPHRGISRMLDQVAMTVHSRQA